MQGFDHMRSGKRKEAPEQVLARMIRDAYISAYVELRMGYTVEEWQHLSIRLKEAYLHMARSLLQKGVIITDESQR